MNCEQPLLHTVKRLSKPRGKSQELSHATDKIGPNSDVHQRFEKEKPFRREEQWTPSRSTRGMGGGMTRRKLCDIEDYLTHEYYPFILEYFEDFYGRIEEICVRARKRN